MVRVLCGPLLLFLAGVGAMLLPIDTLGHDTRSFDRDVKPILHENCGGFGCHINERTSGAEFTTYETLMTSVGLRYRGPTVVPGNPELSPLFDKIASGSPRFGFRMPRFASPLAPAEINTIGQWIREGALNRHIPVHGDANGDDALNLTDAIFILNFLFLGGPAAECPALADADGDGGVNLTDAIFLLNYLFVGGPEPTELTEEEERSCEAESELSFASIYEKVLATSCAFASCHSSESRKGGLDLGSLETAHQQLVGVDAANSVALARGLRRVDPGKPGNSFLLGKLTRPGPGEGNRMPPNSAVPLDDEVVGAIREWILFGAPLEGTVPGVPDIGEVQGPPIQKLARPPVPAKGIQIHLPPFNIGPGAEREIFFFVERPFADLGPSEVPVQRIDIHMLESSHHFIIYEWTGRTNPRAGIRPISGTIDIIQRRRFVVGSQQSFFTLAFPEGVGLEFSRDTSFDLNSHYVNLNGKETLVGEVYINIFFAEPGSIQTKVKPIFEINPFINVPPNETRTTKFLFPGPLSTAVGSSGRVLRKTRIYTLSSHMHRHGVHFSAFLVNDGLDLAPPRMIYDNHDWDDPVYRVFDPPLELEPGQGIRFETTHTYHDPPSANAPPLEFDITSEDEMAILLGYYAIPR